MIGMLHNYDAEYSVIGAAMLDPQQIPDLGSIVRPEDFYHLDTRTIWGAIVNSYREMGAADVVTVSEHLEMTGMLDDVGGYVRIAEVVKNTPTAANAKVYAGIVAEYAQRRTMMQRLGDIEQSIGDREVALPEIAKRAREIEDCIRGGRDELLSVGAGLSEFVDRIDQKFNGELSAMGRSTGLSDLDERTLGLHPGLTVVAARPGMGKTAWMLMSALRCACHDKDPVYIASQEMREQLLIERMIANLGNIPLKAIKDPKNHMTDEHWPKLTYGVTALKDAPLYVDDTPRQTVSYVRERVKQIVAAHGHIGMITIDFLQIMRAETDYGARHDRAIGDIVIGLRDLGREYNCPVVLLCQLNRSLEQRPNKRPVMSDLKESGAIEETAELIIFLYRDDVYNENSESVGILENIIGKQREGELGTVRSYNKLSHARFENMVAYGD